MKPYKILIFILLVICALGLISLFFPKDGLRIGNKELHFPSMEEVLVGPEQTEVELKP